MQLQRYEQSEIEGLIATLNESNKGWDLEDGKLSKQYKFTDFNHAFAFMTLCAIYAEKMDHHPEWFNVYSKVNVQLTTHEVSGISYKDAELAEKMDQYASQLLGAK